MRERRSRTEDTTGVCFETHPAGASRHYSGRYKPATKSSVCDTLIIGHIYGVHIVLANTEACTHTHTYTQTYTRLSAHACSYVLLYCAGEYTEMRTHMYVCTRANTQHTYIFAYMCLRFCKRLYICQRVSYTYMRECSGDDCWKIIGISGTAQLLPYGGIFSRRFGVLPFYFAGHTIYVLNAR